jgi:hypothetical protein
MKANTAKLFSVAVIAVFILSINGTVTTVQADTFEANFEVWFYTQAGSRITESYALYIKQALAPLGIDVKVVAKPFGQFVGDLLHLTTGHPFDLAQIRFAGGGPTPGFMWKFHSTLTSFGADMYQLNNPEFQDWQTIDTGVTTEEVDTLLENLEFELDLVQRQAYLDEFVQLYYEKLLYDFPMVTSIFQVAMWAGYGGPNNELWDPQEGIIPSRAFMPGDAWDASTSEDRNANSTHLRITTVTPGTAGMFDPNQSFDSATTDLTRYLHQALFAFDKGFAPHPGLAYQGWSEPVTETSIDRDIDGDGAKNQSLIEWTYFINHDAMWAATVDKDGAAIPTHAVDAEDFVLAFDMFKNPNTVLNGKEVFNNVAGYEAQDFDGITNHVFKFWIYEDLATPDDYFTFGATSPVPAHILGGTLTNGTYSSDVNDDAWNPQDTDEWNNWESLEGHSLIGPYDIVDFKAGEYYAYRERADYIFPNEWDFDAGYAAHQTAFDAIDTTVDVSVFAPHIYTETPDAYYWAYLGGNTKPTFQALKTFEYVVIDDINANLLQFESGNVDSFTSTALGAQKVDDHLAAGFILKNVVPVRGPELLVFNLLHPDLKKYKVRAAIAHVLDKDEILKIHDGFAEVHHSVVWAFQGKWYKDTWGLRYDYSAAYDLMDSMGYNALEDPSAQETTPTPPIAEVAGALGSEWLMLISAFAMGTFVFVRRRKI